MEGKSYRQIQSEISVPLSTLSAWFSGMEWSTEVRKQLSRASEKGRAARLRDLNLVRGERLARSYEKAREEAKRELKTRVYDPLFVAGLMLYWAEGDKTTKGYLRLTSIDPARIAFFVSYLRKACGVPARKIRAYLTIYPESDEATCKRFWAFAAGLQMGQFTKSMRVKGRSRPALFHNGTCTIVLGSSYLKEKMRIWLDEVPKELMKRAYYETI